MQFKSVRIESQILLQLYKVLKGLQYKDLNTNLSTSHMASDSPQVKKYADLQTEPFCQAQSQLNSTQTKAEVSFINTLIQPPTQP